MASCSSCGAPDEPAAPRPHLADNACLLAQAATVGLAEPPAQLAGILGDLSQLLQQGDPNEATEFLRALSDVLGEPGSDQVSVSVHQPLPCALLIVAASGDGPLFIRTVPNGGKVATSRATWLGRFQARGTGAPPRLLLSIQFLPCYP